MRFDYYAASLPAQLKYCEQKIKENCDGILGSEPPVKPYKFGFRHGVTNFRLYWGGHNPMPFFVSSGSDAEAGAAFVRSNFPTHRVSRADVCEDFDLAGGFDRFHSLIEPIARSSGVRVLFQGDPDPTKETGRTMYYGSKDSDVRVVLYEKGLHEIGKGNLSASKTWVRIELRVRPRKQRKALCASYTASQLWGMSKWSSRVAKEVLLTEVPFTPDPSLRVSRVDQAIAHMFRQYAGNIRAFVDAHGRHSLYDHMDDVLNIQEDERLRIANIADDLSAGDLIEALKNMEGRLASARSKGRGAQAAEISSEIKSLRQKIERIYAR